jgi:hypothetical protein
MELVTRLDHVFASPDDFLVAELYLRELLFFSLAALLPFHRIWFSSPLQFVFVSPMMVFSPSPDGVVFCLLMCVVVAEFFVRAILNSIFNHTGGHDHNVA